MIKKRVKGMRDQDIRCLKDICSEMGVDGKRNAGKQFGEGAKNLKTKWELYHLIEFAKSIHKTVGIELEKALEKSGILGGFEWIRKLGSQRGIDPAKARQIFEALADAQEISHLECLRGFLVFCKGEYEEEFRPLKVFQYQRAVLIAAIADIEDYINETPNTDALGEGATDSDHQPSPPDKDGHGLRISFDEDGNCTIRETPNADDLLIPDDRDSLRLKNVASLLDWQCHLTPFLGRRRELAQLERWLTTGPDRRILLIHGDGGVGKSRLAFHFAEEMCDQGWHAGQPDMGIAGNWRFGPEGMLLIIDDPEVRPERISRLVSAMQHMPALKKKRLRLLLLSRSSDFLDSLTGQARRYVETPIALSSLNGDDEQWSIVEAAWERLQKLQVQSVSRGSPIPSKVQLPIEKAELTTWLQNQAANSTPLMIIALAVYLFSEDGQGETSLNELSFPNIIRYLSEREALRIRNEVGHYRVAQRIDDDIEPEGVLLLKAVAAINNGLDYETLRFLVDDLRTQEIDHAPPRIKHLGKLSLLQNKELTALKPDILAADFLAYCLGNWANTQEAAWIFAATGLSWKQNHRRISNEHIANNFSRLGRLIFDARVRLELEGFSPIDALCSSLQDRPSYSDWISSHLGNRYLEPHLKPLVIPALISRLEQPLDQPAKAQVLGRLSCLFAETGHKARALEAIRQAVEISERLPKQDFSIYGPNLANSLRNLSNRLAETGDKAGGLEPIRRAVEIYKHLAKENLTIYGLDLARSLHDLSVRLSETGDKDGGLDPIWRAVEIHENLAKENSAIYGLDLARSLNDLSVHLGKTGDKARGLKASKRAVGIYEALAKENFAVYGTDLANSLNNLSVHLAKTGDKAAALEALEASKRAVGIYEDLAKENFAVYGPRLANSLSNLSVHLAKTGDKAAALEVLEASKRAVGIYEDLAKENFAVHGPGLAASLGNLSKRRSENGDSAGGLAAIQRAIEIYEDLAKENFAVYGPDLAGSLKNLANRISENGDKTGELEAMRRAIKTLQDLAKEDFALHGPTLAKDLLYFYMQFNLDASILSYAKEVYLKACGLSSDPWLHRFPELFKRLLAQANER